MKLARTARVGLFVAVGLAALIGVAMFLGHSRAVFAPKLRLLAMFTNTNGLVIGSPVRLAGVAIGQVEDIALDTDPTSQRVVVELSIDKRHADRIRKDSVAEMAPMGLLGDMLINISLGSPDQPAVAEYAVLKTRDAKGLADLMGTVERAVANVEKMTDVLDTRLERVLTASLARDLGRIAGATAEITDAIAHGDGLAHALLYDPKIARDASAFIADARRTAERIDRSAAHAERLLAEIEHGDGLVHGLIYGKGGTELLADLRTIAVDLDGVLKEIHHGNGILHSLIYEEDQTNLLQNLSAASEALKEIVTDVEEGKGTVGGLLRDPTIYRDVKGILGEVRRNTILKALVRMTIRRDDLNRSDAEAARPKLGPRKPAG